MSQSDRDRLGITEVSLPTAERIAELRDGPHAACAALMDRASAQLDEAYRKIGEVTSRAEKAERSLAEAVKLLRECVGVDVSEDGDDAGLYELALAAMNPRRTCIDLFSGIAQARIDTVRTFLAHHGGTP